MGCHGDPAVPRGWLRRRNPDEFFHFAYTDLYFGLLRSNLRDFPVAGAVAASAAFPLLIDNARLEDFCRADGDKDRFLALMDGGANDNQGIVEIYHILAELVLGQRRSDVPPMQLERLGPQDTAYILVVNSSVTDSTGPTGSGSSSGPPSLIGFISGAVTKSLEGVDVYSATSYNLRKNLYVNEAARVVQLRGKARIRPIEIGLNGLDQYGRGGLQAALWEKSGLLRPPTEPEDAAPAEKPLQERAQIRRAVLARVMPRATRRSLALSDLHPQCYYDIRARLDASLVSLGEDEQACLREAARWSTALAAQELCEVPAREPREKAPDGLCEGGLVSIQRRSWVLGADEDVGRRCAKVLEDAKVLVPASSAREDECRWLND